MEEEILDKLEEKYQNIKINVKFIDFRKYKIILELNNTTTEFDYNYDNNFTLDYNIGIICYNINILILKYYHKGVEEK